MTRPQPTITSQNQGDAFRHKAQEFAECFAAYEGVVGVLLTGGTARGYADHYSELDLAVYLTAQCFEDWTRYGKAPFPEGDSCQEGWHVDFDYLCYEDEMTTEWEHTKRWDRSYAVLLHDPQGYMRELLASKAVLTPEEKDRLIMRHLVLYGQYFCDLVVPSWLHRGDVLAAHHCLNVALDNLIKVVFLANDELIPFEKWSLNLSYTLAWTPPGWQEKVEQALLVQEMSPADVERRRALLRELLGACKGRLVPATVEGLEAIEARKLEMLRHLRERGTMPAVDFGRRFGPRQAIQSPVYYLLRREAHEGVEWLTLDEERLRQYAANDFEGFLEWDRELLRVLASDPRQSW
jgi:hypothetical protein